MIYTIIFLSMLIIMGGAIIILIGSFLKKGDEMRNFIMNKVIRNTFIITLGILIINVFESAYVSVIKMEGVRGINPFIFLSIIATVFIFNLVMAKRKYEK